MKIIILVSLVALAFSKDSALDTKILLSIPQGELSEEISSIKTLVKDLKREISSIKSQEEKHYEQLETALKKIQGKEIQTEAPSASGPSSASASAPTSTPEPTPSVYTGEQRLLAFENGWAQWDSDGGSTCDYAYGSVCSLKYAFGHSAKYGCAGWDASVGDWKKPLPVMIWYEFESAVVPARFTFYRVQDMCTPKTWHFVGSNEEGCRHGSMWKPLCGDMVGDKIVKGQDVGCDVPKNARESFKCLGIRVYSTTNPKNHSVCLNGIRFWEISQA